MGEPHSQPAPSELSRRAFLAGTTAAAAGLAVAGPERLWAGPASQPAATTHPSTPLVVQARSEYVIEGRTVQKTILGEMLDWCLSTLTGTATAADAWKSVLRPDDVIAVKFNQSAAMGLGTTPAFAQILIESLIHAGWKPEQLVPIEVPDTIHQAFGTTRPSTDWQEEEVDFGSGRDQLAGVLKQVTAIVNVPFMKTHNIAGLTASLKNLSHALVKHPARFHDNHCCPYIGDIVALPQIRDRLRINIVNALRSVFDGGPDATDDSTWQSGMVLAGIDPVAVDTVCLERLNRERKTNRTRNFKPLPYIDEDRRVVAYLDAASRKGLGCSQLHSIRVAERLF
ncbi:MAG: DUF362 domain-containing protein [Phycisphaerae bacterium]|nr:DUF362 domain-containing protein [Phycisphaerae bacterium]